MKTFLAFFLGMIGIMFLSSACECLHRTEFREYVLLRTVVFFLMIITLIVFREVVL